MSKTAELSPPIFVEEKHPDAAAIEDFRPGAVMLTRYLGQTGSKQGELELRIKSYPFRHPAVGSLFVETEYANRMFNGKPLPARPISLGDQGVVPTVLADAVSKRKYNGARVATLKETAQEEEGVYTDRQKAALATPFDELDGLGKILVRAHIKLQTGKFPEEF